MRSWLAAVGALALLVLGITAGTAHSLPTLLAARAREAPPLTMRMGHGLGPYRIGAERMRFDNLRRAIRQRRNDGPGCSGGFQQDSYIDVYPRLRLGYLYFDGKTYLDTIATSREGDRSAVGFVIGKSTRRDVHRRYPGVKVSRHRGGSTLLVYRQTDYEAGEHLKYSFNASRVLVGLETGVGGC